MLLRIVIYVSVFALTGCGILMDDFASDGYN